MAAHGLAAWCIARYAWFDPDNPRRIVAIKHARAVLEPNTDDSHALAFAGFALAYFEREHEIALDAVQRALAFTPNSSIVLTLSGLVHAYAGRFDDAIQHAETALRLSPLDPMGFVAELAAAYAYFFTGRFDEAAEAAQRSARMNPQFAPAVGVVVASCARSGQDQAARAAAEHMRRLNPDFHVSDFVRIGRFAPELNQEYAAALRDGGLPD